MTGRDWIVFGCLAGTALLADQWMFHRQARPITFRRALIESALWIAFSLAFGAWVYWSQGSQRGSEFLAGYIVEKSLSLDNIFVFLMIFRAFHIPAEFQSKALYGGIAGGLVLRAAFVVAGIELLELFRPLAYVLGVFLLVVGIAMLIRRERVSPPERNWLVRSAQKLFPATDQLDSGRFFLRVNGRWTATPLFLALVAIEAMDIVFAADSIPAVLAITRSTFIAYSSNVFAVLGLRALYFAVAGILPRFRFLHQGIAAILVFVGLKMALAEKFHISTIASLAVLCGILAVAIAASLLAPNKKSNSAST